MGATLSLCWFSPDWMFFAHLGDSRIYHLPPDGPMTRVALADLSRAGRLISSE
jgi:protein phosphatase